MKKLLHWMMMEGQELKHRLRLLRTIPDWLKDCICLLIIGHLATFVSAFVYRISPEWSLQKADWFWSPWFRMKMEHEWWLKLSGDYLLNVMTYYTMAKIAAKFSDGLFLVCVIFLGYHVIDFFMFYWNFNGEFYIYLDLFWTALLLISYAVIGIDEKKKAIIKSIF